MSATKNTLTAQQKQLRKVYEDLIKDSTPWTMTDIARELNVQPQTVRSWRKDALASHAGPPHPNQLPDSDIPVTGKPTWKAGTIRRWAIQTRRMLPDGTPQRLKPPGRPRAARTEETLATAAA